MRAFTDARYHEMKRVSTENLTENTEYASMQRYSPYGECLMKRSKGIVVVEVLLLAAAFAFGVWVGQQKLKIPSHSGRTIRMKVTAYCPCRKCCGKYADGITANGKNARETVGVAADPKLLPYGTKLEIPGIGTRVVDDTGGAMRLAAKEDVYHIDVRMWSHQAARRFGVKWLNVKVLR